MTTLPLDPPGTTDGSELKVKVTEYDDEHLAFILDGVELGLANALRRTMIADIPTLAVDQVEIHDNSSVLPDEMIAHRLGMVPLLWDGEGVPNWHKDCECEYFCEKCSVEYELDVTCTNAAQTLEVTSKHLIRQQSTRRGHVGEPVVDKDGRGVLIAKLRRGQHIHLKARAIRGTAVEHAKWSPVSAIGFEYDPHNKLQHTDYWYEVGTDPRQEWPLSKNAKFEREAPPHTVDPGDPHRFVTHDYNFNARPSRFYLDVESVGSMKPDEVVLKGIDQLIFKLAAVDQSLDELAGGGAAAGIANAATGGAPGDTSVNGASTSYYGGSSHPQPNGVRPAIPNGQPSPYSQPYDQSSSNVASYSHSPVHAAAQGYGQPQGRQPDGSPHLLIERSGSGWGGGAGSATRTDGGWGGSPVNQRSPHANGSGSGGGGGGGGGASAWGGW